MAEGGVLSKNGGANSTQAHLGPPEDSSRRRLLLEEATLLAWASWARLGELGGNHLPYFAINRGGKQEGMDPSPLGTSLSLEIAWKIVSVKKI